MLNHAIHRSESQDAVALPRQRDTTDDCGPSIATRFTPHALRQAQRRGIHHDTLALVLERHDRSQKVPGRGRALWMGDAGAKHWLAPAFPRPSLSVPQACVSSCAFASMK